MNTLDQLKTEILLDGHIDDAEVEKLRGVLMADGQVDRAEAELLFELSNACPGGNSPLWPTFFADAIISHVLNDANSPRLVDAEEAAWLQERIMGDGTICDAERELMRHLKVAAKDLPSDLMAFINANT